MILRRLAKQQPLPPPPPPTTQQELAGAGATMKRLILRLSKSSRPNVRQASSDRSTAVRSDDTLNSLAATAFAGNSSTTTTTRTRLRRRVVPFHPQPSTRMDHDGIPQHPQPQQPQQQEQQHQQKSSASWTVPLTLADYHLRHEQLPFCFLFRETLDATELELSLQRVLQHFPILAGQLSANRLSIQSRSTYDNNIDDDNDNDDLQSFVPFCIADHSGSLHDWLAATPQNHNHTSGGGHPALLDVFDGLFGEPSNSDARSGAATASSDPLVTIRITYFEGGGTALGVNWSHVLGDTASLLRVVECWGRDYQQQSYNGSVCHIRSNAACAGMSHHFANALWNDESPSLPPETLVHDERSTLSFASPCFEYLFLPMSPAQDLLSNPPTPTIPHQYVHLPFPTAVLDAMKAFGMSIASQPTEDPSHQRFVSTNDMLTSFGWLLKRALSGQSEHSISMVVNLRGRCGVAAFGDIRSLESSTSAPSGLLGNAITNVVAHFPPTSADFGMACTAHAASAIRHALGEQLAQVPNRIAQSQHGRPMTAVSSFGSFATTSWRQFCLQDIQFGTEPMVGFHGHPSHPLPIGSTFASVIGPAWPGQGGGCTYQLLLPSLQVAEAQRLHAQLSQAFLQWHLTNPS